MPAIFRRVTFCLFALTLTSLQAEELTFSLERLLHISIFLLL